MTKRKVLAAVTLTAIPLFMGSISPKHSNFCWR